MMRATTGIIFPACIESKKERKCKKMKKKRHLTKFLTMVTALTLMLSMSAITAFASETKTAAPTASPTASPSAAPAETNNDASCEKTASECTDENCPVHGANADLFSSDDAAENTKVSNKKSSTAKSNGKTTKDADVDSAKAGTNEIEKDTDTSGMSSSTVKDNEKTVKTGEFDMLPFILGFVVIACGAGGAYMFYKRKAE